MVIMDKLFASFKERAEGASAEVHCFSNAAEATAFILGLVQELGGTALWAPCPFLEATGRPEQAGLSYLVTREAAAQAKVGISQMDWALADTGTLVQDATRVEQRLVSTLSQVHIALIGADRFLPDMGSVLERIKPERAGYLSMITGPSRTADIERVLTIGVHGPERLVIIVVEGVAA
jgi:L-lactate dehydrogenase complex protein LldG